MTALSAFGLVAVMMMLGCYAFEAHSPWFVFGFAIACGLGSTMPFAGCGQRLEGGLQEHHALGKMNRHGVASSLHEPSDRGLDAVGPERLGHVHLFVRSRKGMPNLARRVD